MNGVNLNDFQFEYDLTWMAFFQNAAGRTYTRYGGRESHDAESHLTAGSLLRVMRQVLELHRAGEVQPISRYEPAGNAVHTPEDIPPMKKMMANRKQNKCIHCHDVKVANLRDIRDRKMLKKEMVFTYPSPSNLGICIDPDKQNVVGDVLPNSSAAKSGIQKGDVIQTAGGQRVLTFADFSRVLELAPQESMLKLVLKRDGNVLEPVLQLSGDWRKDADVAWRSSVEAVGPNAGFWGVKANDDQRRNLKLKKDDLALRVTFVWAKWTREAGIRNGDVVVAVDGKRNDMTVRQIHAHLQMNRNWGDVVSLTVLRRGKEMTLRLHLPDGPAQ